jgi:phenylacetate-coenzyme A ligase PaaK-like adenylate-forming protein
MALSDYFRSPLVEAAFTISSFRHNDQRLNILRELDHTQYLPLNQLRNLQIKKLRKLLTIAFDYSPFWRERFRQIGLEKPDLLKIDSLKKIPILKKDDIIKNREKILIEGVSSTDLILNKSGGTTGSPLSYYLDQWKDDVRDAATFRHDYWANYKIGDKLATIWGAPGDLNHNRTIKTRIREMFWGNNILLDSTNITQKSIQHFIMRWEKFKPDVLLAYSGALQYFVKYLKDHNIQISPVGSIITSAETLDNEARTEIETYFGTKIFERYGCREVSVIASECEFHDGLHVNAENLYLEYETIEQINETRKLAKLLITDLENQVFPLIRYQLGDVVVIDDARETCGCGRSLPRIESVAGRISEFIRLKNGQMISGTGLTISLLTKVKGIRKTQIIQRSHDRLVLRIVKDDNFNEESMNTLEQEFKRFTGDNIFLDFEFPDNIEREKSGKYRLVISEIVE